MPLTAGNEIDSYCTKCKLDLNHRIVAMVGPTVKRVECLTCSGQHNYRIPKAKRDAATRKRATKRSTTRAKATAKQTSAEALRKQWEKAIAGRLANDFNAYSIAAVFSEGQLLRHKKFGEGVVLEVVEDEKIQVLFEAGSRLLVHAR
jgi:hypothetical protein